MAFREVRSQGHTCAAKAFRRVCCVLGAACSELLLKRECEIGWENDKERSEKGSAASLKVSERGWSDLQTDASAESRFWGEMSRSGLRAAPSGCSQTHRR